MTQWRFAAATDVGLVRDSNQDAVYVSDNLAIVADGMGGHAAGEVASALTVEVITETFRQRPTIEGLLRGLEDANNEVLRDAVENPERAGMGTTALVVGLTRDPGGSTVPTLLHVGDSRAYQLRDGALRQLSLDHSVAEEWVRMGRLTPQEALLHPRRHQLTRAIGVDGELDIDVLSLHVQAGDRLLLCSDGLSNEVSPDVIAETASSPVALDEAVTRLIELARAAGGRDNISVVLVEFTEAHEPSHVWDTTMSRTPAAAPAPVAPAVHRATARHWTWRTSFALLILMGVAGAFVAFMHWYAYSSYYLAEHDGKIAIYQGQESGVLWFHPKLIDQTNYSVSLLRSADQVILSGTISEPNRATAVTYAAYLHAKGNATAPPTSTTSTTAG